MTQQDEERRPAGNGTANENRLTTCTDSSPSDTAPVDDEAARCLTCSRPIVAAESVRRGFGPHCWTRITAAQRHERAEDLHTRLWALLRRLHSLDARALAMLSAALDDLDAEGITT